MSEGRERSEVLGSNGLHWLWATGADWFVTCVFHKELGSQIVSEQALPEHSWALDVPRMGMSLGKGGIIHSGDVCPRQWQSPAVAVENGVLCFSF